MPETCRVSWQSKILDTWCIFLIVYTKIITKHGHLNIKYGLFLLWTFWWHRKNVFYVGEINLQAHLSAHLISDSIYTDVNLRTRRQWGMKNAFDFLTSLCKKDVYFFRLNSSSWKLWCTFLKCRSHWHILEHRINILMNRAVQLT